jgi:hypothetical protein
MSMQSEPLVHQGDDIGRAADFEGEIVQVSTADGNGWKLSGLRVTYVSELGPYIALNRFQYRALESIPENCLSTTVRLAS